MCFAVDGTDAGTITGAYCVSYASANTETENAATGSRLVTFFSNDQWDGNFDSTIGQALSLTANGLVLTPSVASSDDADGNAAGATIAASWYQPFSADTYTSLVRVSAAETVKSYSILGSDGDAMTLCSASSYTLDGAASLIMASTAAAVLALSI
jgi:hypothetical protein